MNITAKEFRTIKPFESYTENDVQGGLTKSVLDIYLYIYDNFSVMNFVADYNKQNPLEVFGNTPKEKRLVQLNNLNKSIEKGNDPVSIGKYSLLDNNQIEMKWNYYYGENIELIFKGEILLNGDALKGTFYKNGEVDIPSRVYYNIDKPLPDPLIPEDDEDIT
ncbi:hypothetical protein [Zobellia uliginosa]|uniref:hypothetical protein n=1 Tax=Zobellia uliginosa TaxID=143224 RepID=UPI0026E30547|nr:hypothetical protein [Zobellia uliginosa]MDO6515845.1 hypothetical protein [Zobellia uliginosa]